MGDGSEWSGFSGHVKNTESIREKEKNFANKQVLNQNFFVVALRLINDK